MFRKLFIINLSLSIASVLVAVWLAEMWQGPLGEDVSADPTAPTRIARDEYSFEKMDAGSGYESMVEHDIFRPDRKRYIPPEPSPTESPGDEANDKDKPNFEVLGIMILSEKVKYAIVDEKPSVKQPTAKRPEPRSIKHSRRKAGNTPTPTPTPSDLLSAKSYREGEDVKDGWYVAEIRHTLVVFSNGKESFEVEVLKSTVPEETEEETKGKEERPPDQLESPFSRRTPPPAPDKDEATQRFLDALKKAGKDKQQ